MAQWDNLGQAANIAQLLGMDALGLISLAVQTAETARRHKRTCRQFAQHMKLVSDLLEKLQSSELIERPATRRPLEQLEGALRRSLMLLLSCQKGGYLYRLFRGGKVARELREAQDEIDLYLRVFPLVALVALVDNSRSRQATVEAPRVSANHSNPVTRPGASVLETVGTETIQGETEPSVVKGQQPGGRRNLREQQQLVNMEELVKLWSIEECGSGFSLFDFSQIAEATSNFSGQNKIGDGAFGPVYKGRLPDGLEIAVKRLVACSSQGLREFKTEIQTIANLQHKNIVRLLGCCIQREKKILGICVREEENILVYEYMPNGSLDSVLFSTSGTLLNWYNRSQIIEGIVQGLLYLHKYSRLRVIHRDLKPRNILLDYEMNPKISDFGLAQMIPNSTEEELETSIVVGTYGYMAPEYLRCGSLSLKSDVYSFGILFLEVISGKKANIWSHENLPSLPGYAWCLWREGRLRELIDPSLGDEYQITEITKCTQVALLCVQEDPEDRPTMSDVALMLNSESISLPVPMQPAFFKTRITSRGEASSVNASYSANDVSITAELSR